MSSWLSIPPDSDFPLANLPFGIISSSDRQIPRPAVAIGIHVLDLKAFAEGGGFTPSVAIQSHVSVFSSSVLNDFAALGHPFHRLVRTYIQSIFATNTKLGHVLRDNELVRTSTLLLRSDVTNHLPLRIGDYTDFYAGKNHAYNVGLLFRGPDNALQPNYTHLPVAYHGRASSVVVSGTNIRRPWGQVKPPGATEPALMPCDKLDIELELGMFICGENQLGCPVPISQAGNHIFGYVLMNDWSARDIQAWEYIPLGPFTSKNLGTSISPWVILADTLEQTKVEGIPTKNDILPYLREDSAARMLNIELTVDLASS